MITDKLSHYRLVTVEELAKLRGRENEIFMKRTPKSKAIFDKAHENLLDGVPMPWMADWGTDHPIFLEKAKDARCYDVDGNEYIDFCLGDTGAMFGHSPDATAKTIAERAYRGITTMMPTEDALEIGKELSERFGLPTWQVAMTATEANRYVIRNARTLTGRPKILVMQECYHGSLDETLPHIGEDGKLCLRSNFDSNPGLPKDQLTRVVEFNDVEALERELAHEDVAAVLLEPVMTNCGMVLPDEGYLDAVRDLTKKYGSYMIIDETHTMSEGWGGYTGAYGLKPDFVTLGKSIAGGVPIAVYGFTKEITDKIATMYGNGGVSDPMGIGGTLAANQFAIACMRTQLSQVATKEAYEKMFRGLNRLADGIEAVLAKYNVPWSLTRSGARCELQFMPNSPINGTDAKNNFDWELMYYTHIYLHNRGIVITPFHNMMLVSPVTSDSDIDALIQGWDNCIKELCEIGTYNR